MTSPNLSKDLIRITKLIDELLWAFPQSAPKKIAELLTYRLFPSEPIEKHYQEVYQQYANMISVRKSQLKKWRACKDYGRPHRVLVSAHRVEWEFEGPLAADLLLRVKEFAGRCRPTVFQEKPKGVWYVIPNRNRQLEYHDDFVSIRVMPQSGTVRILPGREMDYKEFEDHVWEAFNSAELSMKDCDGLVRGLKIRDRHKIFHVGPVTPFKIEEYKDPLGLVIVADGSHPEHIEVHEGWPTWISPQLNAIAKQTLQTERQTEAITLLTEQIRLHLTVMEGIGKATENNSLSSDKLARVINKLYRFMKLEKAQKELKKGQRQLSDFK